MSSASALEDDPVLTAPSVAFKARKGYSIGIGLLLLVVLLWTSSNFITQDLYEDGYHKPFLVTYLCTSAFSFYLLPFLFRRWMGRGDVRVVDQAPNSYVPLATTEESFVVADELPPLTVKETAHLSATFCFIWFIANWSINAALGYTSVASATILSSTSGFFTLIVGTLFGVEIVTMFKVGAVVTSFIGVLLVSLSDSKRQISGPNHSLVGDILALMSAVFYAMYVILLKVRIKSESRIDMQLFFGFVGLFNIIACWPIGIVLHLTKVEVFELPRSGKAVSALLINMGITLSSDYLYVLAMLKTTPLMVTIGLSLTIPFAVLGDFIRQRTIESQVIAGSLLVLFGFVVVGFDV